MKKLLSIFLFVALFVSAFGQTAKPVYQGQQPAQEVDTTTKPIEKQTRRTFSFEDDGVYFTNDFDGARLNEIERTGENSYTIYITPENFPINMSPWYAFKIWSKKKKEINVRLKYPEFARHRYSPLISKNGLKWKPLEDSRITEEEKEDESKATARPKRIVMRLQIGKKPTWISAQELQTSSHIFAWMDNLAEKRKFAIEEIGKSKEGKPLRLLKMGNLESKKMVMLISRQHPPEVTGYFAMQAFVEKIADKSKLSKQFRESFGIYVVPLMNPDGVDNGHWRHNAGGIDLNRDWTKFNQPEDLAVSEFLKKRGRETGGKFYFGIDFHSTWDDIYYPMDKKFTDSNMPNLVWDWLANIKKALPNYEPIIKPTEKAEPAIVSRNYFYVSHKMEAIVFEIGDNTPREFIRKKGEVGATELMKLMLARQDVKTKSASAKSF
ncbi:MAG: M14 family metallopeptidase [Aridibacter sp.]